MKLKFILLTGILLPVSLFAQYAEDALRFSQTEQGATARFKGLGNAQTALGGDISSLASNPAGIGLFTRSELTFTPDFSNNKIDGKYLENTSFFQKDKAGINQFGLVIFNPSKRYNKSDATSGWLSYNFGIAYNKTNNFNNTTEYGGFNSKSSFGDYFADLASKPDDQLATNAYESYLIENDPNTGYYPITGLNNTQQNTVYRAGSQSELNFSLGWNHSNKMYFGASIGLASLNYIADREFTESGLTLRKSDIDAQGLTVYDETKPYLNAGYKLSYQSNQETKGSGANLKFGFIYRANKHIRFGVSLISPTWYSIDDTFSEGISTRYAKSNGSNEIKTKPTSEYQSAYTLRTPYRINGGLTFILGNIGLICGDFELVDYSSILFTTKTYETNKNVNKDIRNKYQAAVNYKIGTELKLNPMLLRFGFNTTGNPYQNAEYTSTSISAGLGYRVHNLSFDLAYSHISTDYNTSPYILSPDYRYYASTGSGETASINNVRNQVFATIGFRF
ncbi:MAG: hypothetical protein H7Y07_10160 [Pyrinomonadaceae bacterium]|nr:hypothetical protein [Sphingobacteriaceae bacterium]